MSRPDSEPTPAPAPLRRRLLLSLAATLSGFLGSVSSVLAAVQRKPKSARAGTTATAATDPPISGLDPNDTLPGQHIPIDIILYPDGTPPPLSALTLQQRASAGPTTRYVGLVYSDRDMRDTFHATVKSYRKKGQHGTSPQSEKGFEDMGLDVHPTDYLSHTPRGPSDPGYHILVQITLKGNGKVHRVGAEGDLLGQAVSAHDQTS